MPIKHSFKSQNKNVEKKSISFFEDFFITIGSILLQLWSILLTTN